MPEIYAKLPKNEAFRALTNPDALNEYISPYEHITKQPPFNEVVNSIRDSALGQALSESFDDQEHSELVIRYAMSAMANRLKQ